MKLGLILLTPLLLISCGGLPEPGAPPRPEHPRPHLERAEWLNLNGYWGFDFNPAEAESPRFGQAILVPFPWQSVAASVGAVDGTVGWYRRTFTVPAGWVGLQRWLHLEGVGGSATVWIDDMEAGSVLNGFAGTALNITELMEPGAESQITIRVVATPATAASGLVGTVWLEARPSAHLVAAKFQTLRSKDELEIEAQLAIAGPGGSVDVFVESSDSAIDPSRVAVTLEDGSGEAVLRIPIDDGELWSTNTPKLYPLTIRVTSIGDAVDVVQTHIGLRTVERRDSQVMVNGRPDYFRGVSLAPALPTAESDDALRQEVERLKAAGFNLLHIPPNGAEPRLHYWADQLGLWVLGATSDSAGPSSLIADDSESPLEFEITETGVAQQGWPHLVSSGPQDSPDLSRQFRDFTNRVRRLELAQGYVWGAPVPSDFGYEAMAPNMTAADLQSVDYVGLEGRSSFTATLGEKLAITPFVSRYNADGERLRMQVWLRAVNDLGGEVEIFSRPRTINAKPGTVVALEEIEMSVPLTRGLSGTVGFELMDEAGERRAVNYAPIVVNGFDTPRSPRAEWFAPRRLALRAAPGEGVEVRESDGSESVEYVHALAPEEIAASPTQIEILVEIAAHPAPSKGSMVQVVLNGREVGELNLPAGPRGPAAHVGPESDSRYGFLAKLRLDLTADDILALRQRQALVLEFVPGTGGFSIFGERSGRYIIDPTVILVTENVPGSTN